MNIIDAVRLLFSPVEPDGSWEEGMLLNEKHYDELISRRDETEFITPRPRPPKPGSMIVPRHPPPMSWDGIPVTVACTTAIDDYPYPTYPIQSVTELTTNPFEDWVCEWCGNMWANDIKSCDKCGGPKGIGKE